MPAPIGNDNAAKGAEWRSSIKRALARRGESGWREGLDTLADRLIDAASAGDAWALKEIGDRIDGRPKQTVDATLDATHNVNEINVRFSDGS